MQIGNRQFPYPTFSLIDSVNCYKTGYLHLMHNDCIKDDKADDFVILGARYETNSPFLKRLVASGKVEIILIAESSRTVYRRNWVLSEDGHDIRIPLSDVSDALEVSLVAYAKESIPDYRDDDFLDEYEGLSFKIGRGNIVGFDDGFTLNIAHADKTEDVVTSIMTVIKKAPEEDPAKMVVELEREKIKIRLPEKQYLEYDSTKSFEAMNRGYFGNIMIPGLMEALNKLKAIVAEEGCSHLTELSYQWIPSLMKSYKKVYERDLTVAELMALSPLDAAQTILDFGTVKSITQQYEFVMKTNPDNEGD